MENPWNFWVVDMQHYARKLGTTKMYQNNLVFHRNSEGKLPEAKTICDHRLLPSIWHEHMLMC